MVVIHLVEAAPAVRFEPCPAYLPDASAATCAECGWLEEDHLYS